MDISTTTDFSTLHHKSFIGKPAATLPTPSLIISKPILEKNIAQLQEDVQKLGIAFRPHVKTLKSLEVTRMMLGNGLNRRLVTSTMSEIRGVMPLVREKIVDDILYGIPIYPSCLSELTALAKHVQISLLVDCAQHLDILDEFNKKAGTAICWPVFIKIDVGSRRAGMPSTSDLLPDLVRRVEGSSAAKLQGFYCHAGHSYSCRNAEEAERVLREEVNGVVKAARCVRAQETEVMEDEGPATQQQRKLVVSIGSTPTAHVVSTLKETLPEGLELELHAGNYPCNDLQQFSTGLITEKQMAVRVLAEVCSVYPERNEGLINAGTVALTKETSAVPGFGRLTEDPQWSVVRMTQEHGILGLSDPASGGKVEETFHCGQKVMLFCQHACITAAQHSVYYVVDEGDVVSEVWIPWKGW
ncbi:D-serine ammonia-lyase DSD1 [Aspergillus saccharolyticus JOP 1030-1]|uniref:D-serine dehydratase n=1 Tax=Aspergillus saccharolyticus JOP 1030-1 TaxID=1450539 RepID=A0A318ZL81_9EURO|nr:hypothetical protein BP01DRAFT_390276 [Aspergillus saccharolyticus JOP 1030-1]PYH47174.1 hypothetical protein BP01DRAFT_390276 [Aspergillus saccharolyticus JOP 1030-1]